MFAQRSVSSSRFDSSRQRGDQLPPGGIVGQFQLDARPVAGVASGAGAGRRGARTPTAADFAVPDRRGVVRRARPVRCLICRQANDALPAATNACRGRPPAPAWATLARLGQQSVVVAATRGLIRGPASSRCRRTPGSAKGGQRAAWSAAIAGSAAWSEADALADRHHQGRRWPRDVQPGAGSAEAAATGTPGSAATAPRRRPAARRGVPPSTATRRRPGRADHRSVPDRPRGSAVSVCCTTERRPGRWWWRASPAALPARAGCPGSPPGGARRSPDVGAVRVGQPVSPADRPDQRGVPLDDRVPRRAVAMSSPFDELLDRRYVVISHCRPGCSSPSVRATSCWRCPAHRRLFRAWRARRPGALPR